MNCNNCQKPLPNDQYGMVLCPNCGATTNVPPIYLHTPSAHKESYKASKRRAMVGILVSCLFIIMLVIFGVVLYQNAQAQQKVTIAQKQIQNGNFQDSQQTLTAANSYITLPATRERITKAQQLNQKWMAIQANVIQAKELLGQKQYAQAEKLIANTDKTYPKYADIQAILAVIADQKNTINPSLAGPYTSLVAKRFVATSMAEQLAKATTIDSAQLALQQFVAQYDLKVQILSVEPSYYAKKYNTYSLLEQNDLDALKKFGRMFIDEWAKYPKTWVSTTQLKSIVIVKNLNVANTYRAAMPDSVGDALYYDVKYANDEDYMREVIHHEYNHLFTYNITGQPGNVDPAWLALNAPGFKYGNGGATCYQPKNTCLTGVHTVQGFVSGYATSGIDEDKAELYGYLMTTKNYRQLMGWLSSDQVLAKKVEAYKTFIRQHAAQMNDAYFRDIHS